jgi:hypothetical protein
VAERQTVALDVVGSTPTTHPNSNQFVFLRLLLMPVVSRSSPEVVSGICPHPPRRFGPEPDHSGPGPDYSDYNEAALFNRDLCLVFSILGVAQGTDRTLASAT